MDTTDTESGASQQSDKVSMDTTDTESGASQQSDNIVSTDTTETEKSVSQKSDTNTDKSNFINIFEKYKLYIYILLGLLVVFILWKIFS